MLFQQDIFYINIKALMRWFGAPSFLMFYGKRDENGKTSEFFKNNNDK